MICTDGSWKDVSSNQNKVFMLSASPRAAGAVVFLEDNDEWMLKKIVCYRYVGLEDVDSVYPVEVRMVLAAGDMADQLGGGVRVFTDCNSIVQATKRISRKLLTRDNAMAVELGIIARYRHESVFHLEHVKSHPEEALADSWSRQQWGNFVADSVAAGRFTHPMLARLNVDIIEVPMGLSEYPVTSTAGWYLEGEDGAPVTRTLASIVSRAKIKKYLNDRVLVSKHVDPTRWVDPTVSLSAKAAVGLEAPFMNNRLMFDKVYHGGNRGRDGGDDTCDLCGERDSLSHIAGVCTQRDLVRIRRSVERKVTSITGQHPAAIPVLNAVRRVAAQHPDMSWTGMFSSAVVGSLSGVCATLSPIQVAVAKSAVLKVTKARREGLALLWKTRARIISGTAREQRRGPVRTRRTTMYDWLIVGEGPLPDGREGIG
jgi:hypothetical protein